MELTETTSHFTTDDGDQTSKGLEDTSSTKQGAPGEQRVNRATEIVQRVQSIATFYKTPEGEAYVRFPVAGRIDHAPVRSQEFREWIAHTTYSQTGRTVGKDAVSEAIEALAGHSRFEARTEANHLRVAEHGGHIYLSLADEHHSVIEVDTFGWRLVKNAPVNFVRSRGMRPLPMPERGGSMELFRKHFNVTDDQLVLLLSFLTAALRPRGPYPLLNLGGEQGSAKSNTMRRIKALVDPTESDDRSEPRTPAEMMLAANNEHMPAWDNVSTLNARQSDMMARIATGASDTKRKNYADTEEVILKAQRPQVVNGIGDVVTRPDLVERSIRLQLLKIPVDKLRPEAELLAEFERDRAKMLGFLLDALSTALRNLPHVSRPKLPRMADYFLWSIAAEPAWGVPPGSFERAYWANQGAAQDAALEADSVAQAVVALIAKQPCVTDQPSKLLQQLEQQLEPKVTIGGLPVGRYFPEDWPKSAKALTDRLIRIASLLRSQGIEYSKLPPSNGNKRSRLCLTSRDRVDSAA